MWFSYLFVKFNDAIQSKLNPSKKNGITKKQKTKNEEILITVFGMTFRKPINGSNSSKNEVHASLTLVYPILFLNFSFRLLWR